jgi:myo-inositol-1(or 4)-monophosphatase
VNHAHNNRNALTRAVKASLDFVDIFRQVVTGAAATYQNSRNRDDLFAPVGIGADGAPTTWIDRELERSVVDTLARCARVARILSEESGFTVLGDAGDGAPLFVLDPLDGTSNAAMGFPYFALSLAMVLDGEAVAGGIYNFCTGDVYTAIRGGGARCNGRLIRTAAADGGLANMRLVLSKPFNQGEAPMYLDAILRAKRVRLTGCPSLDVASVAAGVFHAYVDVHQTGVVHTHDILAGSVILEEAGGALLDAFGGRLRPSLSAEAGYNLLAVANRQVHELLHPLFR